MHDYVTDCVSQFLTLYQVWGLKYFSPSRWAWVIGRGDWESPPLYVLPQRQHERGEVALILTSPRTLVVGSLNVRGCSSIESKRCEIGYMFGRRGMDVLALCET